MRITHVIGGNSACSLPGSFNKGKWALHWAFEPTQIPMCMFWYAEMFPIQIVTINTESNKEKIIQQIYVALLPQVDWLAFSLHCGEASMKVLAQTVSESNIEGHRIYCKAHGIHEVED